MSNGWRAGQIAKAVTRCKRPRKFWNIFYGILLFVDVFGCGVFIYNCVSDHTTYNSEQIFVEYKDEYLITNIESFEIPEYDKQEIKIKNLYRKLQTGDELLLTISSISGELIEAKYDGETVYRKVTIGLPSIIAGGILLVPMIGLLVFMLVITNIKNPSKRIYKLQRGFLSDHYKR